MKKFHFIDGENIKEEITSMPDNYHLSLDKLVEEVKHLVNLGIKAVILFGLLEYKGAEGASAWQEDGIVQRAVQWLNEK